METIQMVLLICAGAGMFILMGVIPLLANNYSLNGIKSKTVGDGQYGTARQKSNGPLHRFPMSRRCGGRENICPRYRGS